MPSLLAGRKLGKRLVFISVMELQRNGTPHLHMLVGSYLPKDWISKAWESQGGGRQTRIEYADVHRVSAYLSKYFTDESLCNLPAGTRRFSTSKGLALFARARSEGVWNSGESLHRILPGFCEWDRKRGTQYRRRRARSLVAFVAGQVLDAIAGRLAENHRVQLSVEVERMLQPGENGAIFAGEPERN